MRAKSCYNCGHEQQRFDDVVSIGWGFEGDRDLCRRCIAGFRQLGFIETTSAGREYVCDDAFTERPVHIGVNWAQIVCASVRVGTEPAGFAMDGVIDAMEEVLLDEWMVALVHAVGSERDRLAASTRESSGCRAEIDLP